MANSPALRSIEIRPPDTEQEWADYYDLRWQVLREPWQQARGSEKDELEQEAWHLAAFTSERVLISTGRLHKLNQEQGQIRYMATHPSFRSLGAGKKILDALEMRARTEGLGQVILNARQSAADFYQKQGYRVVGEGQTLFGSIPHLQMKKDL